MTDHPAAWAPDPSGRHDHRYWDGTRWTEHVADAGVASVDPYYAPGPATTPVTEEPSATAEADTEEPGPTEAITEESADADGSAAADDARDLEASDEPLEEITTDTDAVAAADAAEEEEAGWGAPKPPTLPTTIFPPAATAWPTSPGVVDAPGGPRAPAPPPPYVAPAAGEGGPPSDAGKKRLLLGAGIAAVVLLLVAAAVAASGGGGDKVDTRQLRADLAARFRTESDISEAQAACKADIYIEDVGAGALGDLDLSDPDATPPADLIDDIDAADARATDECNIVVVPPFESSTTTEAGSGSTPTSIDLPAPGALPPGYEQTLADAYVQAFQLSQEQATCLAHAIGEAIRKGEITDNQSTSAVLDFLSDCDITLEEISRN